MHTCIVSVYIHSNTYACMHVIGIHYSHSMSTGVPDESKCVSTSVRKRTKKVDYVEETISDDDDYLCK